MSSIPTTIPQETMSLYQEVQRLESLLKNSHSENSKLRKKMARFIEKTKLSKSTKSAPASKSFEAQKAKFEKEKAKFETQKAKFETQKAKFETQKADFAEKMKAKKAALIKAKAEKVAASKAKKAALIKAKAEKVAASKAKKVTIIKVEKVEKVTASKAEKTSRSLTGEARKLAQIENKKKLIKTYNEIAFGENQITLITPLKIGEIKKMIADQKRKKKAEKKSRKTQLSSEMKKIVKSN